MMAIRLKGARRAKVRPNIAAAAVAAAAGLTTDGAPAKPEEQQTRQELQK
jgi:hypothetical protein